MLGAHARAAEYQAAKRASARQANREAEEQNLPPSTAPVSLSAFTRSAQPNRNKGNKAYIPLVLEGTPEATPTDVQGILETPTKRIVDSGSNSASKSASSSANYPRVVLPRTTNPPTCPRAMVPGGPSYHATPPVPPRPQTLPVFNRPFTMPPPSHFMFQPPFQFQQGPVFHQQHLAWTHHPLPDPAASPFENSPSFFQTPLPVQSSHSSPGPDVGPSRDLLELVEAAEARVPTLPIQTPAEVQSRFIFGPDDLSPFKQEIKTSTRKLKLGDDSHDEENPLFCHNFRRPVPNPIRMQAPPHSVEQNEQATPLAQHGGASIASTARPSLARRFESDASSNGSFQPISLPNPLRRYTDTDMTSEPPVTAIPWKDRKGHPSTEQDNGGYYDRSTKMQKFVAVQQVLNKKGKTVLNNPERRPSSNVALSINTSVCAGPGPAMTDEEARYLPSVTEQGAVNPPPGLCKPEQPYEPSPATLESEKSSMDLADVELRQSFSVMADEWFELRPSTLHDRKKMRAAVRNVYYKVAHIDKPTLRNDDRSQITDEAVQVMVHDPRLLQEARQLNDRIAQGYSARVHLSIGQVYSEPDGIDVHAGLVRGAGHMLANLSEYVIVDKERQNYFHKTKPVPEYAIDRRALLSGSSHVSIFEEDVFEDIKTPTELLHHGSRFAQIIEQGPRSSEDSFGLWNKKYGWNV